MVVFGNVQFNWKYFVDLSFQSSTFETMYSPDVLISFLLYICCNKDNKRQNRYHLLKCNFSSHRYFICHSRIYSGWYDRWLKRRKLQSDIFTNIGCYLSSLPSKSHGRLSDWGYLLHSSFRFDVWKITYVVRNGW